MSEQERAARQAQGEAALSELIQLFEWPSLEAQMKDTAAEQQADRPRFVDQAHILGIKVP